MRVSSAVVLCAFVTASFIAFAQTPAPVSPQATPGAAPGRARLDPNSPAQAGRTALYKYLDDIAAKDEAARRAEIAKITTREQAIARQQQVRNTLLGLMGGGFEKTPLNAKVLGSTQMDGFRIEKILFESQPKFFVTALLYLPDATTGPQGLKPGGSAAASGIHSASLRTSFEAVALTSKSVKQIPSGNDKQENDKQENGKQENGKQEQVAQKLPAIVIAPGHGATGKASDFTFASTFARNGFAVLSYDPIGQGERLQYPDPAHPGKTLATAPTGEHGEAGLQPTLIGDAVARYFVWDGMRAVDYLLTRPEIDGERIGAFGCSGGGVMTAMLGAADKRIKAIATACYLTTMDTLLPSIGPQDAEQSTPGFIAAGFDFADWVELAAPRPYAMVGTVGDMFPWAGFLKTATEARWFYSLFDPKAAGVGSCQLQVAGCQEKRLETPTGPTLNPDTVNTIARDAPLQVIAGIGGHGNLRPLTSQIVSFFLTNLAHSDAAPIVAGPSGRPQGLKPGDQAAVVGTAEAVPLSRTTDAALAKTAEAVPLSNTEPPAGALQVTATGQVATSYPDSVTVHTLNLRRAAGKIPNFVAPQTLLQVQTDIREVTSAEAVPGGPPTEFKDLPFPDFGNNNPERGPAVLLVMSDERGTPGNPTDEDIKALAMGGPNFVLGFVPRPSPPGGEETKSPILGPFYLTELRAELVGKTLLGMRVDDVIHAVDYLAARRDIDPNNITAVASGHMGLVLLHAAALDPRLKHITIDHVLESYDSLLKAPMPLDAPQDILPGVLLKYDIPDLVRVLGPRVTATDWLPGTANLGGAALP